MRIAFGHKARSGKDTAAEYLQKNYGGGIVKFASPLYEISHHVQETLSKTITKDTLLLQTIGTSLKTVYGARVFVDALVEKVKNSQGHLYVTDLRFPEEADALKSLGFTLVKIERKKRPIDRDPHHTSETALDDYKFDFVIQNDGSLDDLYFCLDSLIGVV